MFSMFMARLSKSGLGMVLGLSLLGSVSRSDDGVSTMNANNMYSLMQTSSQIAINNNSNLQNESQCADIGFKEGMYILGCSVLVTATLAGLGAYFFRK